MDTCSSLTTRTCLRGAPTTSCSTRKRNPPNPLLGASGKSGELWQRLLGLLPVTAAR